MWPVLILALTKETFFSKLLKRFNPLKKLNPGRFVLVPEAGELVLRALSVVLPYAKIVIYQYWFASFLKDLQSIFQEAVAFPSSL